MRRRTALRSIGPALGGALAGCLGTLGVGGVEGVSVDADDGLDALDVRFTVDVEQAATAEHPMKLRITMHNRAGSGASDVAQTVYTGPDPPFSARVGSAEHGAELVLTPLLWEDMPTSGEHDGGGCWTARQEASAYRRTDVDPASESVSLDAGGGVYLTYYVLAAPANDPCVPAGTYRFESAEYGLDGHTWGFDLEIEEPIEAA